MSDDTKFVLIALLCGIVIGASVLAVVLLLLGLG